MPIYDYEYNGKIYSFESDEQPNEQEVMDFITSYKEPEPVVKETPQVEQPVLQGGVRKVSEQNPYADIVNNPDLTPEQMAEQIQARGEKERRDLDLELAKYKTKSRVGLGLQLLSATPGLNVIGGGALFGLGQSLIDDKNLLDTLKQTGLYAAGAKVGELGFRGLGKLAQTKPAQAAFETIAQSPVGKKAKEVGKKIASSKPVKNVSEFLLKPRGVVKGTEEVVEKATPQEDETKKLFEQVKQQIKENNLPSPDDAYSYRYLRSYIEDMREVNFRHKGALENFEKQKNAFLAKAKTKKRIKQINDAYDASVKNANQMFKNTQESLLKQLDDFYYEIEGIPKVQPKTVAEKVAPQGKEKTRGFVKHIERDYGKDVANQIEDATYQATSHAADKAAWEGLTAEQQVALVNNVDDTSRVATYGKAQAFEQAIENGEEIPLSIRNGLASKGTELAQQLEAYKHFTPDTPAGIVLKFDQAVRKETPKQAIKLKDEAQKIVDEIQKSGGKDIEKILRKRISKPREVRSLTKDLNALNEAGELTTNNLLKLIDKHYKLPELNVEDYQAINNLANNFANAIGDREQAVAAAQIKKFIWDKMPKKWTDRAKTYRNINMLLSFPGRTVDLLSTAAFQGLNAIDEAGAKVISKITRSGTRADFETLSPDVWKKGLKRGLQEGIEDVKQGINTARSGEFDRYELGFNNQFEGVPVLGGLEKGLSYTVRVPDRMFYEARYSSALNDLIKAGFSEEEAAGIAQQEALQAVFQKNGWLANASKQVRDIANNLNPNLQIGTHLMPFVQTPANLIMEGIERTPLGIGNAILKYSKATTPAQVREAEMALSKGLLGTGGLTLGGGALLNNIPNNIGSLNPQDQFGNDVTGLPPQSIVIGDKAIGLANVPYLTIPAAIGKSLMNPEYDVSQKLLGAAANTTSAISEIPMLKTLGDLAKSGQELTNTLTALGSEENIADETKRQAVYDAVGRLAAQQTANIVSQYIPLASTVGTIRNAFDPYNRELMTDNNLEYIGNRLQNRIPGLSQELPIKYNVLGEPSLRSNIENPVLRGLEATLSPIKIRNYTEEPIVMKELEKYNQELKKPKRVIKIGNEKRRLSNEEYSEYTKQLNGIMRENLNNFVNSEVYDNLSESDKIKVIKGIKKETKAQVDRNVFGIEPKEREYEPSIMKKTRKNIIDKYTKE